MKENLGSNNLHEREIAFATKLHVSASPAESVRKILGIPERVSGLTIVDLAAGACPLTGQLLTEGANAFAIDRIYDDREELLNAVYKKWLPMSLYFVRKINPTQVQMVDKFSRRIVREFLRSFEKYPDKHIVGWLTDLPLESGFSDLTVSYSGVSELFEDQEVLEKATQEAVRITKAGGRVVIAPFLTNGGSSGIGGRITTSHNQLVEFLRKENVGQVEVQKDDFSSPDSRLQIIKF